MKKLYNIGVRGSLLDWIGSYITDREMVVKYGCAISDKRVVDLSVPQGTVLGPLLFIYVNDLPLNINTGHVTMYADDTTIMTASETVDGLLEAVTGVCRDMEGWCRRVEEMG